MENQHIYNQVAERYSAASRGTALDYGHAVAKAFGYSEQELADIPEESNLGLSCGNPMALASIREVRMIPSVSSPRGRPPNNIDHTYRVRPSLILEVVPVSMLSLPRARLAQLGRSSVWT